jgi:hypothetical protein
MDPRIVPYAIVVVSDMESETPRRLTRRGEAPSRPHPRNPRGNDMVNAPFAVSDVMSTTAGYGFNISGDKRRLIASLSYADEATAKAAHQAMLRVIAHAAPFEPAAAESAATSNYH